MRTLSNALVTALGGPVQKPAWLVYIGFSPTPLRVSSFGTLSWNGQTWTAADVDVQGLKIGALEVSGSIVFGNADNAYSAVFLNNSPTDVPIQIWGYDAGATAAADPVLLVPDGVGAGASITERQVLVGVRDKAEFMLGPRATVSREFGFNSLLPAGKVLVINGISFTLERKR